MRCKSTVALVLFFVGVAFTGTAKTDEQFSPYVGAKGEIQLPKNYRTTWSYLGSWVVPDKKAPGYGFHDVFTQPETVKAYEKTGQFPDGAVLIKEIRKVESADMTTGHASWAGPINVWFVMVKDRKDRFPKNANWGDGWGWALFKASDPTKNVSTDYKKDCLGCHVPAKSTDWVYTKGYTIK